MNFDWNYYITRLLSRSDSQNLKRDANIIIENFNLLEGQMVEGLRDPSTLEYGLWLSDRNTSSYLEYSPISKSLNRGTIVEESLGMEMFNNVFEIGENGLEFFKVYEGSLVKVMVQKICEKQYKVTLEIYEDINELLEIIFGKFSETSNNFSYYKNEVIKGLKEIGNSSLFTLDVKTIDTIIKVLPDKTISKNVIKKIELDGENNIYLEIAKDIYANIERLNSKVKRK